MGGEEIFSLCHHVYTSSGIHPIGTGGFSLVIKWPGHEADCLPPSAEVKNVEVYLHSHNVFIHGA